MYSYHFLFVEVWFGFILNLNLKDTCLIWFMKLISSKNSFLFNTLKAEAHAVNHAKNF